jgi:putative sigma-54 modulation protein
VKVVIHDRTEELPARVRIYAEQRLLRIARHFDRVAAAEVEFDRESSRGLFCSVHITVHMDGRRLPVAKAAETAADPQAALDLALDKLDRQVVKLKEKVRDERKRAAAGSPTSADLAGDERDPGPERIRVKLQPETLEEAAAALDGGDHPCYVFQEESSGAISVCFRRADGGLVVIETTVI